MFVENSLVTVDFADNHSDKDGIAKGILLFRHILFFTLSA